MGSLSSPTSHNRNFVSFSKFLPNKMLGSRDSNSLFLSNLQRPRDSPLHNHNNSLFSLNNSNSSLSLSNSSDNSHNNNKAFQMPSSNRLLVSNSQATSSS